MCVIVYTLDKISRDNGYYVYIVHTYINKCCVMSAYYMKEFIIYFVLTIFCFFMNLHLPNPFPFP